MTHSRGETGELMENGRSRSANRRKETKGKLDKDWEGKVK